MKGQNIQALLIFIIYISFILILGLVCMYLINALNQFEPIFLIYNQEGLGNNLAEPFIHSIYFSLIGFVVGLLLSFPMYFLLLITKKIRKYSFDYINVQSKNNLFVTTIKHSFMTSLFSFNFAFILIKIPLVLDYFVDISTFEGSSSIIPQVYGYFALLPLTIFITSSIYTAIWLLSYCDLYATSVKENQIVKRHNIANSYSDIIRNFTEISSIITLILFSFDYYNDVVNSGYDIPLFSILAFPVFALLVCPLYFFILNVLVIKINPLKKYIYRIY